MAAAVDQRATTGGLTADEGASEPPASKFTAVNGQSPPTSSRAAEEAPAKPQQPSTNDTRSPPNRSRENSTHEAPQAPPQPPAEAAPSAHRADSPSSLGKRKWSSSSEHSGESPASHKRPNTRPSPPADAARPQHPLPNGAGGEQHAVAGETVREQPDERADRYGEVNNLQWGHHRRDESAASDAQLAEVLRGASQQLGSPSTDSDEDSPEMPEGVLPTQQQTPPEGAILVQLAPGVTAPMLQKQRKRNFSNRTKTGCLTCRARKKKCDEGKPTCHNCARGGFTCKGYSQVNNLHKMAPMRSPHQQHPPQQHHHQPILQAENGAYEPAAPHAFPPRHVAPPEHYDPPPPGGSRMDGVRSRPRTMEEEQHLRSIPTPQEPNIRAAYSRFPAHEYYPPQPPREMVPRDTYPQMPPLPDMPRAHKLPPPPQPIHPAAGVHRPPQGHPGASHPAQYSTQRMTAQLALEHPSSRPNPVPVQQVYPDLRQDNRTQKERMLSGSPFDPRDPQLKQERQECESAVYRFNKNAIDPTNLSEEAKTEQFRQILQPHLKTASPNNPDRTLPAATTSPPGRIKSPFGWLGKEVDVSAPFYCNYGYNIRINDGVDVGPNCRIMDECTVEIGARTIIGPDVKIITVDGDHKSKKPGDKRKLVARKVTIGEDCFIGAGSTILPGITIFSGSTIGAGAVVHKDIRGPQTVVNNISIRRLH